MIEIMGGPFRFNKKERKRLRRRARNVAQCAEKFEIEGTKPVAAAGLRKSAEWWARLASSKRRKKSKTAK
jgi:hypothetical protein